MAIAEMYYNTCHRLFYGAVVFSLVITQFLFPFRTASAEEHIHSYLNGVCMTCGETCPHILHNINGECIACREYVGHHYEHGICAVCKKKIEFVEDFLDASLLSTPVDMEGNPAGCGTVERLSYYTVDYSLPEENREALEKNMEVYLPYGYDSKKQYNVLFLCAGQGSDETYWFSGRGTRYYDMESDTTIAVAVNDLLDNMISRELCGPLIVVSITPFLNGSFGAMEREKNSLQFAEELSRDILPTVILKYSTYAESTEREQINAARDHFGFYGASYGTFIGYESVFRQNLDLVAWYGFAAGCTVSTSSEILEELKANGTADLPVRFLYTSSGEMEDSESTVSAFYRSMVKTIPGITKQDSIYIKVPGAAHEGRVWGNGLYNCLRIFFLL